MDKNKFFHRQEPHQYYSWVADEEKFPINNIFYEKFKYCPSFFFFDEREIDFCIKFITENNNNIIHIEYETNENKEYINYCYIYLPEIDDVFIKFRNVEWRSYAVKFIFKERTKKIDKLIQEFLQRPHPIDNTKLYVLSLDDEKCFNLLPVKTNQPEIDFDINYNEDFKPIHEIILNKLSEQNGKGLVMLQGDPGTGKTTYIRYLISVLGKKVIYIPPEIAETLANPGLIGFLLENRNSILVVEDAENILIKRHRGSSQAIANILNLSDGLLSDCANIQIVATFNTNISDIDEALLRKGRLIAKYEFKKLSEDRCKKLAEKLGVELNSSYTLANIYNAKENSFSNPVKKLGFEIKN